jgi:hypothetical protein
METNHRLARAIQRLPLLRQVVAQYAERIRLLEREGSAGAAQNCRSSGKVQVQSIGDDPKFRELFEEYDDAVSEAGIRHAYRALIAYIDGGTASTAAPEGYVLVPTKITEEMHVAAVRAIIRATGNDDFPPAVWDAMIAAAPSPLSGTEEAN